MSSRYGSHALAVGLRPGRAGVSADAEPVITSMAGFELSSAAIVGAEPVITSMAGFAGPGPIVPTDDRDPRRLEIPARRLPTNARRGLDPPQAPPEAAKYKYLLLFVVAQDVAHSGEGPFGPPPRQRPGALLHMAGFGVIRYGRFWVITEVTGSEHLAA